MYLPTILGAILNHLQSPIALGKQILFLFLMKLMKKIVILKIWPINVSLYKNYFKLNFFIFLFIYL